MKLLETVLYNKKDPYTRILLLVWLIQRLCHAERQDGFLGVQAVFGFVKDYGVRAVDDLIGNLDIAVGGQGVHIDSIFLGQLHAALIHNPTFVGILDALTLSRVRGG